MGYCTDYSLGIALDANANLLGDSRRKEVIEYLLSLETWDLFHDSIKLEVEGAASKDRNWCVTYACKWYEHDEDMKALSLKFQDVIFMLHGEGEEEKDKWNKYYLNGMVQTCNASIVVTYPEFNFKELK